MRTLTGWAMLLWRFGTHPVIGGVILGYMLVGSAMTYLLLEFSRYNEEDPIEHDRHARIIGCAAVTLLWPVFAGILVLSWAVAWRRDGGRTAASSTTRKSVPRGA